MTSLLFSLYIIIVLGLAWFFRIKNQKSKEEFLINNKKLGSWAMAFSSVATQVDISTILFAVGIAYIFGAQAFSIYLIVFIQYIGLAIFAPKLWRIAKKHNLITTSDIFLNRAGKITNILAALITIFLSFAILSAAFSANATLLNNIFGWNPITAVIFSAVIVLLYLWLGGFSALIKTDTFQMIILLLLMITPFLVVKKLSLSGLIGSGPLLTMDGLKLQIGFLFVNLTNLQIWQKIIAAKSEKVAKRGAWLSIVGLPLFIIPLVFLSFVIKSALPNIIDPQAALYQGMGLVLPEWFSPIILVALYAAMMSSVDTNLFGAAINLVHNILGKISKRIRENIVLSTRIAILLILTLSAVMSLRLESAVWFLFNMITIVGILCFPLYVSLYRKLSDVVSALAIICGLTAFFIIQYASYFQSNFAWKALPAVITGIVIFLGMTLRRNRVE